MNKHALPHLHDWFSAPAPVCALRAATVGGTFAAIMLLAAGCANSGVKQPEPPTQATVAAAADTYDPTYGLGLGLEQPDDPPRQSTPQRSPSAAVQSPSRQGTPIAAAPAARPQVVNLYGEIAGHREAGPRTGFAASFQQRSFADEGYDSDVTLDPTGKLMAFASTRNSEHPHIYIQRVSGQAITQLTGDECDDAYPSFSSDGKSIAFCSTRSGNWQIYVMDADGRNVTQVTGGRMQAIRPTFSPDNTRLAYCALSPRSNQWELWVANLTNGERRMIGYGLFPTWSPDRSVDRIAFQRSRQRGSRWFSVWTLDLVDGEARHVTEVVPAADGAAVAPTWSPDGKKIAYTSVRAAGQTNAPSPRVVQDVWTVNVDGTDRQQLTDGRGLNVNPCWGADNNVYFISNRGGGECVWSVQTDARRVMTASLSHDDAPGQTTVSSADTGDLNK